MAVKVILKASQDNSINEKEQVQSLSLKALKRLNSMILTFLLVYDTGLYIGTHGNCFAINVFRGNGVINEHVSYHGNNGIRAFQRFVAFKLRLWTCSFLLIV